MRLCLCNYTIFKYLRLTIHKIQKRNKRISIKKKVTETKIKFGNNKFEINI